MVSILYQQFSFLTGGLVVMGTILSLIPALQEHPRPLVLAPTGPYWELSGVSPFGTVFFAHSLLISQQNAFLL